MEKSLVAVMRLKNYLSRCKQWEISLAYYDENLDCLDNLKETINFSTLRNGHICIPAKKEYKYKIKGNVIDKSSTGGTLFIEPSSVGEYYETLQLLRIHEENHGTMRFTRGM